MWTWLKAHKGQVILSLAAAVGTLLAGVGLMSSSGYLISRAALRPPILDLMLIIVAVRFFALSRAACRYAERMLSHDLTFRWLMSLRTTLYRVLEPRLPGLLLQRRSGDLLGGMVSDIDTLQNLYLRVAAPCITAGIIVVVTTAGLHIFDPRLAWITFFMLLLNGLAAPGFIAARSRGLARQQIEIRARCSADFIETLQGLPDLLAFGREKEAVEHIQAQSHTLGQLQQRQTRLTAWQDALSHICSYGAMWLVLLCSIPLVQTGLIPGVYLALLALGVLTSFEAVQSLGTAFHYYDQSRQAQDRLSAIEASPVPTQDLPEEGAPSTPFDISFEQLHFAYGTEPVLQAIDFRWPAGQHIGLVGPSGAGKSTLAHLLLRFQDPHQGRILFGRQDSRTIQRTALLNYFSVVPQHTHCFNASIRDNLRIARPQTDDDTCWHVLEQARLADFVHRLPDRLDTWIGEQGAQLSGGERQRLAIARAILKNAPYFLLDEPTVNLDTQTEQAIIDCLLTVTANRGTLWITHRLLRLDELDRLIVIDQGQIAETGTHDELLAANAYYARMLRQQNQVIL